MHDLIAVLRALGLPFDELDNQQSRVALVRSLAPEQRDVLLIFALGELPKIPAYERTRKVRATIAATNAEARESRLTEARAFIANHPRASLSRVALHVANGAKKSTVEKFLRRNLAKWRPKENRDNVSLS